MHVGQRYCRISKSPNCYPFGTLEYRSDLHFGFAASFELVAEHRTRVPRKSYQLTITLLVLKDSLGFNAESLCCP